MYKIALVEDEIDLNNLIKTYLEKNNYEVVSYINGTDAINNINEATITDNKIIQLVLS